MHIEDFLSPADALLNIAASDKPRLLRELAGRSGAALGVPAERIAEELLKREALGSTGTGGGVAVPHARIEGLDKPYGMLARLKHTIDFNAIDGRPVDLVFLLLLPAAPAGGELNALASVARKLRNADALRALRRAGDADALYCAMTG